MLESKLVGELTTKEKFNKYMGYTAKDLPKEDKKAEGYIVELEGESNQEDHKGFLVWVPKVVYEASANSVLAQVIKSPHLFNSLSPLKQKNLKKVIKESL